MSGGEGPVDPERISQRKMSRRSLLTGMFLRGKDATPEQEGPPEAAPLEPAAPETPLFSPARIAADHQAMVDLGPRFTGSTAHDDFIGWMKQEFAKAGCYERSSIEHAETLWTPRASGLRITTGAEAGDIPVAAFRARAGGFAEDGSAIDAPYSGRLVYLGKAPPQPPDAVAALSGSSAYQGTFEEWFRTAIAAQGSSADGAIVVIDFDGPAPFDQGTIGGLTGCYYTQSPNHLTWPLWNQQRRWQKLWTLPIPDLRPGPVGAVFIVDASREALSGQFLPPRGTATRSPIVLLDRDAGARVRRAASGVNTARAELTMSATNLPTRTHSIVFKLAGVEEETLRWGRNDIDESLSDHLEYVVFNANSDGVGVAGGNGCIALVHMARHLGALKAEGRGLRRTLVFSAVTGSIGAERFPGTQGFLDEHPKISRRMAFGMTAEQLGCSEWIDDAAGYRATGYPEPALMYHDQGLTPLVYDPFIGTDLLNHGVSTAMGLYLGAGRALAAVAPSVSFVAGPTYVNQAGPGVTTGGSIERFDAELCARQYGWLAGILEGFERLPFRGRGVFPPA